MTKDTFAHGGVETVSLPSAAKRRPQPQADIRESHECDAMQRWANQLRDVIYGRRGESGHLALGLRICQTVQDSS